jgi:hypothetical protein
MAAGGGIGIVGGIGAADATVVATGEEIFSRLPILSAGAGGAVSGMLETGTGVTLAGGEADGDAAPCAATTGSVASGLILSLNRGAPSASGKTAGGSITAGGRGGGGGGSDATTGGGAGSTLGGGIPIGSGGGTTGVPGTGSAGFAATAGSSGFRRMRLTGGGSLMPMT